MLAAGFFLVGCNSGVAEQPVTKAAAQQGQKVFPSFMARDLQGNEVTNEIFAQKKITVVNIWGTFCPPCSCGSGILNGQRRRKKRTMTARIAPNAEATPLPPLNFRNREQECPTMARMPQMIIKSGVPTSKEPR